MSPVYITCEYDAAKETTDVLTTIVIQKKYGQCLSETSLPGILYE